DPPFVADQPLAIAIMHKHDPVPPLPNDVPRPIADLVYAMLAKNPEDRPESARHVADRADVIREARNRTGYSGPVTSDLPVVPNYPAATSTDVYQGSYPATGGYPDAYQNGQGPQRPDGPRSPGNRTFLFAGIGAAAIGVVAIIAVLISSNGSSPGQGSTGPNSTMPVQTAVAGAHTSSPSPTTTQPSSSNFVPGNTGANVGPTTKASSSASKTPKPTASRTATSTPTPSTSGSPTPTSSSTGGGTPTSTPTDTTGTGGGTPTGTPTNTTGTGRGGGKHGGSSPSPTAT
ncbi:MAG TPA: hypothetical protein VN714_09685, partial [Trebonia sp.]|nr:hypothetical protein [Trebonia sp.]